MPLPRKTFSLRFPNAGVSRRMGFSETANLRSSERSYGTPWALNVFPQDALAKRLRGGSRPALVSADSRSQTVATYRGRTLTFGDAGLPNAITVSRLGDSSDLEYGDNAGDPSRATILQLSEAEETGGTVTAVVPHKDRNLLGATASTLWALSGDPVTGGMRNISRNVGIISQRCWTKHEDMVYFLSSDGLYRVGADGSGLESISRDLIPDELLSLSDSASLGMAYSLTNRGIYIYTAVTDWFFSLDPPGFWPISAAAASHVLFGPIQLSGPGRMGTIIELEGTMAASSASVTWAIVAGDSAEEVAVDAKTDLTGGTTTNVLATGTFAAGRNSRDYPRVRGAFAIIWLSSAGAWGYESMRLHVADSGRWRN